MKVYAIYVEAESFGYKIYAQSAEVISHCMLNNHRVYELDTNFRLPGNMHTSTFIPCMLDTWFELGADRVFYTDSEETFDSVYNKTINKIRQGVNKTLQSIDSK